EQTAAEAEAREQAAREESAATPGILAVPGVFSCAAVRRSAPRVAPRSRPTASRNRPSKPLPCPAGASSSREPLMSHSTPARLSCVPAPYSLHRSARKARGLLPRLVHRAPCGCHLRTLIHEMVLRQAERERVPEREFLALLVQRDIYPRGQLDAV